MTAPTFDLPAATRAAHFPFESRFLEVDGHRVHYIDEGVGPTLLLVHGNPTWSFLYRHLVLRLRDRFRCVAVDHPGFGLSTPAPGYDFLPASHAAVLEGFVQAMDLRDFTPMVQDWGGPTGLWVAGRQAERIRGLIIGNTWAWPIDGDPHFERFSGMMGGPLGKLGIRHFNAFVNMMIPMGCKRRKLGRVEMQAYRGPFPTWEERQRTWIFPREIRGSSAFLAEAHAGLAALANKPTLIVWGDADIAFKAKERERFEASFPNHRTVPLPGAGHYIQEDAPEEIAAAIVAWWDERIAPA
jgi:haloalkane dehalogenase